MGCPAECILGQKLTFTIQAKDGTGAPVTPTGDVNYVVYENTTTAEILTDTMTKDFDGKTGFCLAQIACTTANGFERYKTYTVRITATIASVSVAKSYNFICLGVEDVAAEGVEPTHYCTQTEVQKDGNVYSADDFRAAVEMADAWIDKICVDHFLPLSQTLLFDGSGVNVLSLLPATLLKVISITSVTLLDPLATNYVYKPSTDDNPEYYTYEHFLKRYDADAIWPTGMQNIQIIGSFGWSTTPKAITQASALLTRMVLDPDSELDMTALSLRIGDLSYTRRKQAKELEEMTGIPGADRILRLYLNPALLSPLII